MKPHFCDFLGPPDLSELIFQNWHPSFFWNYDSLTSCKKIEKNWSANSEILRWQQTGRWLNGRTDGWMGGQTDRQTDGRMNRAKLIGHLCWCGFPKSSGQVEQSLERVTIFHRSWHITAVVYLGSHLTSMMGLLAKIYNSF